MWRCTNSIGSSIVRMWPGAVAVDLVDHRGERRRLARAGRAGDEDEAARPLGELVQAAGRPSSSSVRILYGIRRNTAPSALALEEDVDAEAGDAGDRVREIDLPVDLEPLLLLGREDAVEELLRVVRRQRRAAPPGRSARRARAATGGEPAEMCRSEAPERFHALEQLVDRVDGGHSATGYRQRAADP